MRKGRTDERQDSEHQNQARCEARTAAAGDDALPASDARLALVHGIGNEGVQMQADKAGTAVTGRMQESIPALQAHALCKVVPGPASEQAAGAAPTGGLTILDDINLSVARGETLAVLGASGSGKSTLLGLLAGLDLPSSGSVRIFGEELFDLDEDARAKLRARTLGFVFQSFQLLPHLTALENVLLPLELGAVTAGQGLDAAAASSMARELLARVGLGERLRHYPTTLSGGEQQRVALARALAPRPSLLIADEPTGNLDEPTGRAVIDLLFDAPSRRGATLALVTHDQALAARCDRTLRMRSGVIEALAPALA
jgi:putative ABC transport system ATP-binding protein